MKLEASLTEDIHAGVQVIQSEIANLTWELQVLKKDKETRSKVWCTKWKREGHYKDQFSMFKDYTASGVPNLINLGLLCEICRTRGQHHCEDCYLLYVYVQTTKNLFCNFCRSIGHDEKIIEVMT